MVEMINKGGPALFGNREDDPDRLFGAALLIDGVSAFMRASGKQFHRVSGEPSTLPKWILTPVGKRMVQDRGNVPGRFEGGKLIKTTGPGGSVVQALGFQKGSRVAGSFVFSTAAKSVAAPELLSLKKIGTISVYFFAEEIPGDSPLGESDDGPGTKKSKDVPSRTFVVKGLKWHPSPVEVWHIIYRYEGDPTLPRNLKPRSSFKVPQTRRKNDDAPLSAAEEKEYQEILKQLKGKEKKELQDWWREATNREKREYLKGEGEVSLPQGPRRQGPATLHALHHAAEEPNDDR